MMTGENVLNQNQNQCECFSSNPKIENMFSYKYDHKLGTFDPVQVYFTERFFFKILFLEGGQ